VPVDFSALRLTDVSRTFGRRRALNRVSLTAQAGTITALLGHNGAGKSTLLSIAATLISPTSGSVRYGDLDAAGGGAALRARIGMLGHDLYLYGELTAAENLRFFARVYNLDAIERRVDAALERAGLSARRDDIVSGFSRGMRQRLALERALIHEPRLLLLDEPFTGLDRRGQKWVNEFLLAFKAGGGTAVVATHSLGGGLAVADRVGILAQGRLLLDRPATDLSPEALHRLYESLTEAGEPAP
jgi:heme exporter protein A